MANFVLLCVAIALSSWGCDTCPPTGYDDGHQAGYDFAAASVRATMAGTAQPNQTSYILRYWRGDPDMAAILTGNIGSVDLEGEWSPGCSEYQFAWQLGYQDGHTAGWQGAAQSGGG